MKVLYDEDRASHVGPEPCIMLREEHDEASAGAGVGQSNRPEPSISPA